MQKSHIVPSTVLSSALAPSLPHRDTQTTAKDRLFARCAKIFANLALILDVLVIPMLGITIAISCWVLYQAPRDSMNAISPDHICQCMYPSPIYGKSCDCKDYSDNKVTAILGIGFAFLPDFCMLGYMAGITLLILLYVVFYLIFFCIYALVALCYKVRGRETPISVPSFDSKFRYFMCCNSYEMAKAHQSFVEKGCSGQSCEDFWSCSIVDQCLVCCNGNRKIYFSWLLCRVIEAVVCMVFLALYPDLDCNCNEVDGYNGSIDYNGKWDDLLPFARQCAALYIVMVFLLILFRWLCICLLRPITIIPEMNTWAFTYLCVPIPAVLFLQG